MLDDDMTFGLQLRAIRTERGLSQVALAADLNLSPGRVSEIETGKRDVLVATARAIAAALDVPVWRLLGEGER